MSRISPHLGCRVAVRTGHLRHKTGPGVDRERENLATSVKNSDKVKAMDHYLPPNPMLEAKNASGSTYHSDGRLRVVILR